MDVNDVLPPIPQRVEKGICWLEEQGAWDWAQKIVAAVDAASFRMSDPCLCAVGRTLGHFYDDFFFPREGEVGAPAAEHESDAFGFDAVSGKRAEYNALEAEWERAARDRLAWYATIEEAP